MSEIVAAFKFDTRRALGTGGAWLLLLTNAFAAGGIYLFIASLIPGLDKWYAALLMGLAWPTVIRNANIKLAASMQAAPSINEADLKGAREQCDKALEIYPAVGDRLGEANVRKALGNLALAEGRIEDAIRLCSEAAAIHKQINDRLGLAGSLDYLARAFRAAGQPAQAVLYGEAALGLLREIGDRFGQAIALTDQGGALWELNLQISALGA